MHIRLILFVYNIFLKIYTAGIYLVSAWNPKARLWLTGRKDVFEKATQALLNNNTPVVWMHCASLGEFEQGRPLLESIKETYPSIKLVLTFFSPSGYELTQNYKGADHIFYLPMDGQRHAQKWLTLLKPSLVLWIKYEYWYYYLQAIHQKNIPLLLVSGVFRPDQPFFKWYGGMHKKMLSFFTHLFVQNNTSGQMLASIGFTANTSVNGDTRFDRVTTIAQNFKPLPVIENFIGNHPVIVAGSTWPEDEEALDHFANTNTHIKFIIAPHEVDEQHLTGIEKLFHHTIRFSLLKKQTEEAHIANATNKNVLIIDNIGMLSKLYKYATICYVGGGLGNDGIHNILEAAVYGIPVVYGHIHEKNFEAIALIEAGGAFSIENALQAEAVFNTLLADKNLLTATGAAAGNYVLQHRGATKIIIDYIQLNRLLTS
jgi:3-deoxy-D-manno-octulosonic-acid transferase